jgi:hypothetical protein
MKVSTIIGISLLIGSILLVGCGPTVTVTPAGHEKQYEVTIRSNDFAFDETEELIQAWHQKARETCGSNYNVISRDVFQKEDPFNEIVITGLVECQ